MAVLLPLTLSMLLGPALPVQGLVSVGTVDGIAYYPAHACNLLRSQGVAAGCMGSRSYGVFCSKADSPKAAAILRADAAIRPYNYVQIEGNKKKLGGPDESTWTAKELNLDLDKIDSSPECRSDANLRGLARETLLEIKGHDANLARSKPFIESVRFHPEMYMDEHGKWKLGYRAVVQGAYRARKGAFEWWMWSWDEGRSRMCRGGSLY
jgi:hypothetical protein